MKGFFVTIKKSRKILNPHNTWIAELHEKLDGWKITSGENFEQALKGQKEQYHVKKAGNEIIPKLVTDREGPIADGKCTRFIEIE